jgi:hypothetical protein
LKINLAPNDANLDDVPKASLNLTENPLNDPEEDVPLPLAKDTIPEAEFDFKMNKRYIMLTILVP